MLVSLTGVCLNENAYILPGLRVMPATEFSEQNNRKAYIMRYIHELREGEMVSEVYLCKNKITGKTKSGKSYYSLQLVDASGTMDGKIWELNSGIGHFESMNYVEFKVG